MALDSDSFLPDVEDCAETWRRMRWNEGPFLEASDTGLRRWVYFAREMDKGRAAGPIGEEIGVTEKTARRMARAYRQALHARREGWLLELSGEVEADDVHVKGGQQERDVSGQKVGARPAHGTYPSVGGASALRTARWWCLG